MHLFETERLVVRQFTQADAEDFYRFNSHPDVMRFIRPVKDREACDAFLEENIRFYQEGSSLGRYHVSSKTKGNFIGSFSLLYMSGADDVHVGYGLMPPNWGQGYALELLRAGVSHFFTHSPRKVLFAITEPANASSQKVLEKAGFSFKARVQQDKLLDVFCMTREDYGY